VIGTWPLRHVCQRPSSQSQARAAQSIDAGQSGHRARPSLAGSAGLVGQRPTKHNGRSHVACPQAAAKALLVAPLHATPVMSCAPCPARVACCSLRVATSHTPDIHWCVWSRPGPSPQGFWSGAARSITSGRPTHPGPSVAPGFSRLRRLPARCSQTDPPLTAGEPKTNSLHGAARRAPALAHEPHPSLGRGCSSGAKQ
jgi:hypothetical protein